MAYNSINDLHKDVFHYLLEKYQEDNTLCFSFKRDEDKGTWFEEDEDKNSLIFSFWDYGYLQGRGLLYGIFVSITKDEELVITLQGTGHNQYTKALERIATKNEYEVADENRWYKRMGNNNFRQNIDILINKELPAIEEYLSLASPRKIKRISQSDFRSNLRSAGVSSRKKGKSKEKKIDLPTSDPFPIKTLLLKKIAIENIGHFNHLEIDDLKQVNIFVGKNGSGKSTLLRAIAVSITGANVFKNENDENRSFLKTAKLHQWVKIKSIEAGKPNVAENAYCQIDFTIQNDTQEPTEYTNIVRWEKEGNYKFAMVSEEIKGTYIERKIRKSDRETKRETHLTTLVIALPQGGGEEKEAEELRFEEEAHPSAFSLLRLIKDLRLDKTDNIKKWIAANDAKANKDPEKEGWRYEANALLFEVISKITDKENRADAVQLKEVYRDDDDKPHIIVTTPNNPEGIYLDLLSDGYRNLFYWVGGIVSALYRFHSYAKQAQGDYEYYARLDVRAIPAIALIDEIDTYLHPDWQVNILRVLVDTFPKIQFLVTTHSELVVSGFQKEQIYVIEEGEVWQPMNNTYGLDSSMVLSAIDAPNRRREIDEKVEVLRTLLLNNEIEKAEVALDKLRDINEHIKEISRFEAIIKIKQRQKNAGNQ